MALSSTKKIAIQYQDGAGIQRVKNCGNAASVRECITWLKREGFKFLGKEVVAGGVGAKTIGARQIKHKVAI
ncbi:MAG: hypothetical protein Q7K65_01655 [Candidatus Buchananbacteria bacterium]|nr:hypothetical protein [Candidatus Buchananbacteria bacterium]